MSTKQAVAEFLGVNCALDPRAIGDNQASDAQNTITEDGALRHRRGYLKLQSAQSGFTALYGFCYAQGYSSSNVFQEEYVSFENLGSGVRPYTRDPSSLAPTEILNGAAHLSLNASDWQGVIFNANLYCFNSAEAAPYRHIVGTITSFTKMSIPTAPANRLSAVPIYQGSTSAGLPYLNLSYAGLNVATNITYVAPATQANSSAPTDGTLRIGHAHGTTSLASFEVDIQGTTQFSGVNADMSYNDILAWTVTMLTTAVDIDPSTMYLTPTNADGSPVSFTSTSIVWQKLSTTGPSVYAFVASFDVKDRTLWDNIRKLKFSYTVTVASSTAVNNTMQFSKLILGCVNLIPDFFSNLGGNFLNFYYTYGIAANSFESGPSASVPLTRAQLLGVAPYPGLPPLGAWILLTGAASSDSNVDTAKFYVENAAGNKAGTLDLRQFASHDDATLTTLFRQNWQEVMTDTQFTPTPFQADSIVGAFVHKGSFVWLYKGGASNVKWSRVGDAERQSSVVDSITDDARGATFTLADNESDQPLMGISAGNVALILGSQGVYAQGGSGLPSQMTPPRFVPLSFGGAGKFAGCRWRDDEGQTGMAYVSKQGQVYFCPVSQLFASGGFSPFVSGDGAHVIELSTEIRTGAKSIQSWLLDGQSLTDLSKVHIFADVAQDCLVVSLGKRALVLRRPNLTDGKRHWEAYTYTSAATLMAYVGESAARRVRFMSSDGTAHEWEWNSSTSAFIEGTSRDGGSAPPANGAYWQSKNVFGPNRRVNTVVLRRDTLTDTPSITAYCSRDGFAGVSRTFPSGLRWVQYGPKQQGLEHYFKIVVPEGIAPIRVLQVEYFAAGDRRQG